MRIVPIIAIAGLSLSIIAEEHDRNTTFEILALKRFEGHSIFCVEREGNETLSFLEQKSKIGALALSAKVVEINASEHIKNGTYSSQVEQHFVSMTPGNTKIEYSYFDAGVCASATKRGNS